MQNWDKFSKLLLETGDLPIVEDSRKDDFWGAKPEDEEILVGANVLGRLLMQLREQVKNWEITSQTIINPLPISDFLLYGREIKAISKNGEYYLNNYIDSEELVEKSELELDKYDSLQFILPHIVESLQEAERTDKDLAKLFKTNLTQMREWLKRSVQLNKIKKLSKPVRYVAESQLPLIR